MHISLSASSPSSSRSKWKMMTTTTTTTMTIGSAVAAFTILLLLTHLVLCDKPHQSGAAGNPTWDLARSRNGRFLNVPIFYGDWVPITNAKSVIERVAASLQPGERADDQQQPDGHDRADHHHHHHHGHDADVGNVDHTKPLRGNEAEQPGLPHGPGHRQRQRQRHHHNEGDKHSSQQDRADHRPQVFIDDTLSPPAAPVKTQQAFAKPPPLPQQRPQWRQRPVRRQDKKRRTRKLPPPQSQSYFEKFTNYFTGGSSGRAEDETSPSVAPQPQLPLPTQVGPSLPSLPVYRPPPPPPLPKSQLPSQLGTSPPKVIQDTFPSSSVSLQTTFNVNTPNSNRFTPGKVYDISNQYRQSQAPRLQTARPTVQKTQHYHHNQQQQQQHHHHPHQQQHTQTQNQRGQGRQPNIRILPAPDLSQNGPPLIEIGGGVGPSFSASPGATEQSHLSGFVPVNFEPLTSGEPLLDKKQRNFSVVLGTDAAHQVKSPKHLAKLFKDGRLKKEAFISPSNAAPDGFKKIDLPFMENHEGGHLPSVFIAPVGFKVPDGYKGHPLPYDPEVRVTTGSPFGGHGDEDFLTSPLVEGGSAGGGSVQRVKNKLKLAKDRPSLADFYRNKARKESDISQDLESGEDTQRKKKRVLTKVVRRPAYKISKFASAPATSAPYAPEEAPSTDYPTLRIDEEPAFVTESPQTHILDAETKLPPLITPGSVVGSLFDPITQTYTWKEIAEDRNFVEEAPAQASSTTTSATSTTVVPDDAGTSTEKVEENEEWQTTIRLDLEYFAPTTQRPSTEHQFILVTTTTEEPEVEQTTEVPTTTTTAAAPTQTPTTYPTTPAIARDGDEEGQEVDERVPETTSQAADFYEPTPFNNFKPIRKYEGLRYKNRPKQQVRLTDFSPTKLPRVRKYKTTTTPDTTTVDSKYRGGSDGGGHIFGTRIRARKRPTFWANGYSKENRHEATTTTSPVIRRRPTPRKSTKTEQYKKKYRPLFDKLYEKLTKGTYDEEEFKKESKEIRKEIKKKDQTTRKYWRGRSTTTPNPYTINAEIYEVHPDSGRTWVPAIVTTTTEQHDSVAQSTYAPDLQFGDFDQQSQSANALSSPEAPLPTIQPTLPPLEYNEYKLPGTEAYVHETADKHSTPPTHPEPTTTVPTTTATGSVGVLNPQTPYTYPEAPINYDYAANDVIDRADQTLNYDDDTDWDIGNTNLVDEVAPADPGRLSEYAKGISPSDIVANAHNQDYVKPVNIVNEHSQQRIDPAVEEGSFVPFLETNSWKPSYVEIDRSTTLSPPTTDVSSSGDDVIYITEEDVVFDKSPDTFSVPVGTSFDVPSSNVRQVTTTTTRAVEDETTPYHTTFKIDSTSKQEQEWEPSPSTIRVTTPEPEITTYTRRIVVTTTGRQHKQDQEHGEEISSPPSLDVEQTTKDDGATPSTTVIAANDGSVSTLSTTDFHETETPTEADVSTVAQEDAVTAKVTTTESIAWEKTITGSSYQTSTGLENVDTSSTESEISTRPADRVTTTEEATTAAAFETTEGIPERIRFRKTKPIHPPPPPKKPGFLSGLINFFLPANKVPQRKIPDYPVRRVDNIEVSSPPTTFETTHTESTAGPKTTTTEVDSTSASTSTEQSPETTRSHSAKEPKAIDTSSVKINLPVSEKREEGEGSEGIGAYTTPKSVLEDKLDAVVKKREQLIKNWTARKYNKGDKKSRYAAATTTTTAATETEDATDSAPGETTTFLPFAPTVRPKSHRLPLKKSKKKISRKPPPSSILNYKKHLLKDSGIFASQKKAAVAEKKKQNKKKAIPLGSRADVYKKWGGGSLSQAEFESKVLGVSTATEVSVRSMICVRGRCFNAEDEKTDDDQLR